MYTRTHTHTQTHKHTNTHTHTQTYTHTHTHQNTPVKSSEKKTQPSRLASSSRNSQKVRKKFSKVCVSSIRSVTFIGSADVSELLPRHSKAIVAQVACICRCTNDCDSSADMRLTPLTTTSITPLHVLLTSVTLYSIRHTPLLHTLRDIHDCSMRVIVVFMHK
jgi:hypothetical protein